MATNRQTGFICNFYSDTKNGIKNELEAGIRESFTRLAESRGYKKEGNTCGDVRYKEAKGARIFKKRFGKRKTLEESLAIIVDTGLSSNETEARNVLQYMVENDIPYQILIDDWHHFTLVPSKDGKNYFMNRYSPSLGDLFGAWKAAASVYD